MNPDFNTTDYQMAHGHNPRGRGSWAFFPTRNARVEDAFWTPGSTTYSEAKKMAREWARANGFPVVFVGS